MSQVGASPERFCYLAEKYKDTVYRVALNFTGSPQDSEDAVQEALMRLYTARRLFEDEEHVKRWLIRVTVNYCKNLRRSALRHPSVDLDEVTASVPFEGEEQVALFTAVMELPELYRVPLYLFYYEEYSVKEIASILGISDSNVTTRLSRARAMLRGKLREDV